MKVDFLIAGQGLSGTVLALQLMERGASVLVVDPGHAVTSSRIAAGLIAPITGQRLHLTENIGELWPVARDFYLQAERTLASRFFTEAPVVRLWHDEKNRALGEKRRLSPEFSPYLAEADLESFPWARQCHIELGGLVMRRSGWLAVGKFLDAARNFLANKAAYRCEQVRAEEVKVFAEHAEWQEVHAKTLVFCEGAEGVNNLWFDWLPYQSVKGEILIVKMDLNLNHEVLNRAGTWILPQGDGEFRVGSTYDRDFADAKPTAAGREAILRRLQNIVRVPFAVTGHTAAVRPMVEGGMPRVGRHPGKWPLALCNGMASKGVLRAPWYAARLVEHLLENRRLPREMDVAEM